jgi:hypothetical protein
MNQIVYLSSRLSKMADFLGIRVADFTLKTKWLEMYAYTTFIEMAKLEVTESIDYTTALVDETMTVNKTSEGRDLRQCDRRDVTSHRLGSRSRRSRVSTIPRELSWRSRSGGFATGCMVKDIEIGNDIDLFIVGTEERAQMIMEFVLVDVLPDHTSFRTGNAVTFFVKDAINEIFRFRSS